MSSSVVPSQQDSSTSLMVDDDVLQLSHAIDNNEDSRDENDNMQEDDKKDEEKQEVDDPLQHAFRRKPRKKNSKVWKEMEEICLPNGSRKAKCSYCKEEFSLNASGSTTQLIRHLDNCAQRKSSRKGKLTQQVLSLTEDASDVSSITNFTYDHAKVRELASHMVLVHEYPFSMMDHLIFNKFMKAVSPFYKKINRQTVKKDCLAAYEIEKKKLKTQLNRISRINITTDLWKSGQKIQYMVVTAHFVDSSWTLQKRVLNFCNVPPPHTGVIIADALSSSFIEWGIEDKISSITVDNAAYNDVCVRRLKNVFLLRKTLELEGRLFHIRCCAHILNLLVQDGLSQIGDVIDVVREGIKYWNNSEARLIEVSKICKQLHLPSKKLILDCPTRWNSTYLMLDSALQFKEVFPRYQDVDVGFQYVPSELEWLKVGQVCQFLGVFHVITNIISGSDYPTSNLFLTELCRVKELLIEKSNDPSPHIKGMAKSMSDKFDKNWGACNLVLSLGAILDPRFKMVIIDYTFPVLYGQSDAPKYIAEVRKALFDLYIEYVTAYKAMGNDNLQPSGQCSRQVSSSSTHGNRLIGANIVTGMSKFEMFARQADVEHSSDKSELDEYLSESRLTNKSDPNAGFEKFDVLKWWKANTLKFKVLSQMAIDILSIPITTVASESTFSAGGRVIDDRRSSMSVETVQMLLCASDWIRNLHGLKKHKCEYGDFDNDAEKDEEYLGLQEIHLPD